MEVVDTLHRVISIPQKETGKNALSSWQTSRKWRQPSQDGRTRLAGEESAQSYGRAQKVYGSEQSCSSKDWGSGQRKQSPRKVVKPKLTTDFPGAFFREGVGELSLRAHEEGVVRSFFDTTNVGHTRS